MLSNSPGNVHFERAPFKLTAEYMHIMDSDVHGFPSPCFEHFKVCGVSVKSGLQQFFVQHEAVLHFHS
jgi:hypothetical protein